MSQYREATASSLRLFAFGLVVTSFLMVLRPDSRALAQLELQDKSKGTEAHLRGMAAAFCSSGAELAAAFANSAVQLAYLSADIHMTDADWEPYKTPITLWRNMTISGAHEDANSWPLLDLAFTLNKVMLGAGVKLQLSQLAILNWRKGAYFQGPGLDLLATNPDTATVAGPGSGSGPPAQALVLLENVVIIQRSCLPSAVSFISTSSLPRPPQLPGEQSAIRPPASHAVNCTNDTAAPAVQRCWVAGGIYWDLAMYGYNFDDLYQPVYAGYNLWFYNSHYKCETVLSEACIANLTAIGCYYQVFSWGSSQPQESAAARQQPEVQQPGDAPAGGGGGGSSLLGPLLGGLLGGIALVIIVGLVALLAWRRRRLGRGSRNPSSSSDGGGAKFAASMDSSPEQAQNPGGPCSATRKLRSSSAGGGGGDPKRHPASVASASGGRLEKLPEAMTTASAASAAAPSGGAKSAAISTSHEAVSVSLCGGDPYQDAYPQPIPSITPVPGPGGSAGPAAGGGGGGGDLALTPSACRFWSQTGMQSDRSSSLASLPQLRCTTDELALLPVTPLTPLQPGVNLDARAVGTAVKLLPVTLGKGAFGRVVEGQFNGERVAVKLLNTGLLTGVEEAAVLSAIVEGQQAAGGDPSLHGPARRAWRSLVQEVEVLARCQHPNIVRLLAASLIPPRVCLVMELMDTSLDRLLHGVGAKSLLPLGTVLHIALQVARALSYLHPTVLHRDLKPANVLIAQPHSDKPIAKLADFGLSRLQTTVHATKNTEVGTAPYVAPEGFDVLNPVMSDRAEIYAFGVILWEMLAGRRPWQGASTAQIAFAVSMLNSRLPLRELSEERCPHKVRALMVACWEKDPARRPAAAEVVKALVLAQEALAITSTTLSSDKPLNSVKTITLGVGSSAGPKTIDRLPI